MDTDELTQEFTIEDVFACWDYHEDYLVDILNGSYPLEQARENLRGLIGSSFDRRVTRTN